MIKGILLTPFGVFIEAAMPTTVELVVAKTSVALTRTLEVPSVQRVSSRDSILASVSAGDHGAESSLAWQPNVGTMPSVLSVTAAARAAAMDAAVACSPAGTDLTVLPAKAPLAVELEGAVRLLVSGGLVMLDRCCRGNIGEACRRSWTSREPPDILGGGNTGQGDIALPLAPVSPTAVVIGPVDEDCAISGLR